VTHRTLEQLQAGLDHIRRAPTIAGPIELIVRRPGLAAREELTEATLDPVAGLVGDNWLVRGSRRTPDGKADPQCQLTIMGTRAIALIAGERARWPLAGDQLFVDLDLSEASLPAGALVQVGGAVVRISEKPHTGCPKFVDRFGPDALHFVATPDGRALRVRGLNAVVVEGCTVRVGDVIRPCAERTEAQY
jgi:hypothetical protein